MAKCAIRLAIAFCAIFAASSAMASIKNPFLAGYLPSWTIALDWATKLRALPNGAEGRTADLAHFTALEHTWQTFIGQTHPICLKQADRDRQVIDLNADDAKYTVEAEKYRSEKARYDSTPTTVENQASKRSWYQVLYAWWLRVEDWRKRLASQVDGIKNLDLDIQSQYDRAYDDLLVDIILFNHEADRAVQLADLEGQIGVVKAKIKIDRRSLLDYQRNVPGFHEDVEKMAEAAEEARIESRDKGIDSLIGLTLDGAIHQANLRETVSRSKLLQVKQALISNGVRPADAKKILAGWLETKDTVKAIRHTKEMYVRLSHLKEFASIYDSYEQQKYWGAIATCLGMFIQTPLLKLAVTNFALYSYLMFTGLSYKLASDRVRQFDSLSDSELKAVASLSSVYIKHIKALKNLQKRRDDLFASPI